MLLDTILTEIERTVPLDFRTVKKVREYLLAVGQQAEVKHRSASAKDGEVKVWYTEAHWDEVTRAAVEEARANYLTYIATLTPEQAVHVKPVLYRHVMSDSKRRTVGEDLAEHWSIDPLHHYWYPLWLEPLPPDVLALQDFHFYKEVGVQTLQNILLRRGIKRIWELNEMRLDPEYEMDPRLCGFTGGLEMYWSSRELDWLIYESHESSITFAGDWLITAITEAWPNWQQRIYTGYDYERSFD